MSHNRRRTTKKFREKHPRNVGDFVKVFDSNGGHPARIYYADPINDRYYIQRFTRHPRKDRKKLLFNIDPESQEGQWLVTNPEIVNYDDMRYELKYSNYRIHPNDQNTIEKYQKYNFKKNR